MKILNKSIILAVLLAFPVLFSAQALSIWGSVESGGATKIEAGGEAVITPDGSPIEIPIRYTGDVNKPSSANSIRFNLKVGEKTLVSKHLGGITITLNSLIRDIVNITVIVRGGCGPNADPYCLGAPGSEETFNLKLGELKIIPGTGASLTFAQKLSDDEAMFILTTPISRPFPTPLPSDPPTRTPTPTPNCPTDGYWDPRSNTCRPTGPYPTPTPTPTFILRPLIAPVIHKVIEVQQIESGSYQVKAKQKGRILFLVPVEINVSYSVEGSAVTSVKRPWWSFLVWVR